MCEIKDITKEDIEQLSNIYQTSEEVIIKAMEIYKVNLDFDEFEKTIMNYKRT
mgnify:CR=1 FL=1